LTKRHDTRGNSSVGDEKDALVDVNVKKDPLRSSFTPECPWAANTNLEQDSRIKKGKTRFAYVMIYENMMTKHFCPPHGETAEAGRGKRRVLVAIRIMLDGAPLI